VRQEASERAETYLRLLAEAVLRTRAMGRERDATRAADAEAATRAADAEAATQAMGRERDAAQAAAAEAATRAMGRERDAAQAADAEAATRAMGRERDAAQAADAEAATRAAAERVSRVADVLIDVGVMEDRLAAEILLMLGTALRIRGVGWRPEPRRVRRLVASTASPPSAPPPWRVIPAPAAGDEPARPPLAPVTGTPAPGSRVLAIIVTGDRMIAPAMLRFPAQPGSPGQAVPSFADLTATDDAGTGYMLSFIDSQWAGGTWTGTLMLRPAPPDNARILTIASPNGLILRAPLATAAQSGPARCEVTDATDSPGERLLTRRAESLIAAFARDGRPGRPDSGLAGATAAIAKATGALTEAEVKETLEAAGALSPLSPVPGQLAALGEWVARAGAPGSAHGRLPARWATVLAHYARRHPPSAGTLAPRGEMGAIGADLPPVDGVWLVIAGVRTSSQGTLVHLAARGLRTMPRAPSAPSGPAPAAARDTGLSFWVRDETGTQHLGVLHSWHAAGHDTTLRLFLLPPLTPGAPGTRGTLTIEVTGTWQRLTADVPVQW
jgi:hypothetical protein